MMDRLTCSLLEVKFAPAADPGEDGATPDAPMAFSGYGAVFGNMDGGGDVIAPGAFAAFLADVKAGKQPWPAMLSQHGAMGLTTDDLTPIGVWADLSEDGHGLKVDGVLADTDRGEDMYTLMKMAPRPAIDGLSIGYIAKEWVPRTKPEDPRRLIKRIDLIEISPVTRPMNKLALVTSVKSDLTERDFERLLTRDAGLTRSDALVVINQGFKSLIAMRDAGSSELAGLFEAVKRREAAVPR
jgi:HK97 family phage prohead protease